MKITKQNNMNDGTLVRIEDWSEDYSHCIKNDKVAAYPICKKDIGYFIKKGESMRLELNFKNEKESLAAYHNILSGEKNFSDYLDNINPKYHESI